MAKIRADQLLLQKELAKSRTKAQALIMAGEVYVQEKRVEKPGQMVLEESVLEIRSKRSRFVSRGGEKLEGALLDLDLDVKDLVVLDVGCSTGGFTDCLLQRGAKKVFGIDVGRGQLDPKIERDPRVEARERFHVRGLSNAPFGQKVDLVVIDVSFISLTKVLSHLLSSIEPKGKILMMIKPQFEATSSENTKGVVKDPKIRNRVIQEIRDFCESELKLKILGQTDAQIKGPKGNQETFLLTQLPSPE